MNVETGEAIRRGGHADAARGQREARSPDGSGLGRTRHATAGIDRASGGIADPRDERDGFRHGRHVATRPKSTNC